MKFKGTSAINPPYPPLALHTTNAADTIPPITPRRKASTSVADVVPPVTPRTKGANIAPPVTLRGRTNISVADIAPTVTPRTRTNTTNTTPAVLSRTTSLPHTTSDRNVADNAPPVPQRRTRAEKASFTLHYNHYTFYI